MQEERRGDKMMTGLMLLPDGCWHALSVCFWVLAVPFVSAAVFVLVALVTTLLHRRRGGDLSIVLVPDDCVWLLYGI